MSNFNLFIFYYSIATFCKLIMQWLNNVLRTVFMISSNSSWNQKRFVLFLNSIGCFNNFIHLNTFVLIDFFLHLIQNTCIDRCVRTAQAVSRMSASTFMREQADKQRALPEESKSESTSPAGDNSNPPSPPVPSNPPPFDESPRTPPNA